MPEFSECRYSFCTRVGHYVHVRKLSETSFEVMTLDGKHITYLRAQPIVYETTIAKQIARSQLE